MECCVAAGDRGTEGLRTTSQNIKHVHYMECCVAAGDRGVEGLRAT